MPHCVMIHTGSSNSSSFHPAKYVIPGGKLQGHSARLCAPGQREAIYRLTNPALYHIFICWKQPQLVYLEQRGNFPTKFLYGSILRKMKLFSIVDVGFFFLFYIGLYNYV